MRTNDADVIQMNVAGGSIVLHNYGTMLSNNVSAGGAQAVDFTAITTGANITNNYSTGLLRAFEADAVRTGVNGQVFNWGTIRAETSTFSSSDGIDFQNNSGAGVVNYSAGGVVGGRHGIAGGALNSTVTFASNITNYGNIVGNNGSGINLDGFNARQSASITNLGVITGTGVNGDGDGIDVDGLANIHNQGTIRSTNSFSSVAGTPAYSEGITIGGGTIFNNGLIEGRLAAGNTNAFGRGITLAGNDITSGALAGTREGLYGNATITNDVLGTIRGQNDSALVVEGAKSIGFTVAVYNRGIMQGGSSSFAAIRGGADNISIQNSGVIDGTSSGKAFAGGSGNNSFEILGGSASVLGNVDGGTGGTNELRFSLRAGETFSYSGTLSNFQFARIVDGTVTLSGNNTYTGSTIVRTGATLILDGANRLAAASSLELAGGTLQLANAGGANGQTFSSLVLSASSSVDLGGSSLTFDSLGSVSPSTSFTLFNYIRATSPDYALRFLGNVTGEARFLALMSGLTINGIAAGYRFDGTYTDVAPVPLPASAGLVLAGLGLLGAVARRRARPQPVATAG
jgi:autotransporter-associated beta strand protein